MQRGGRRRGARSPFVDMSRGGIVKTIVWCLGSTILIAVHFSILVNGSEFPERECCDPVYPIPEPTSRAPSAPTPTGRSGTKIKSTLAILNCLFARQLCFEDPSCSAILEIIPRVCGPELVACSTVTVPKCQAALKTLQAFPFFKPTCLCREPHVDPNCNSFRDFLFDHPCVYVLKKDPMPIDPLPTCNHALSVCQRGKTCVKLFEDFKTNCKAREGKCRMESRDACHEAWTQLRLSPMFGCICPNNHMKRRCDRIFSMVNHNPCVEFLPSATVDLSGTDSALYPFDSHQENFQEFWFPPTSMYPYFLFPATATTRTFNEIEARYRYHESSPELQSPEVPRPRGHGGRVIGDTHSSAQDDFRPRRPILVPGTIPHDHDHDNHHHLDHSTRVDSDPRGLDLDPGSYPRPIPLPDDENDLTDRVGVSPSNSEHEYASVRPGILITNTDHRSFPKYERERIPKGGLIDTIERTNDSNDLDEENRRGTIPVPRTPYPTVGIRPGSSSHSGSVSVIQTHQHDHHRHRHPSSPHQPPAPDSYAPTPAPSPSMTPGHHDHDHQQHQHQHHNGKKFAPRPTYEHRSVVDDMVDLDDNELRLGGRQPIDRLFGLSEAFEGFVDKVKVISHPDNSTSFELIESQLENPLIDADHQDLEALKQLPPIVPGVHRRKMHHHGKNHSNLEENSTGKTAIAPSPASETDVWRYHQKPSIILTLSSTCHQAFEFCQNDPDCRTAMQPVLNHCSLGSCAKNACMEAMQNFYRNAAEIHTMEIAFCLCRKTDDRRDDCIIAQEKMHPVCAQRVDGTEMPTCHSLAEVCREEKTCRARLEYYEQSCAVDSVTKKCAGVPNECRRAMIGILGTELRSNCACKGTDLSQLYDCLGWQRLLWVNPCVVESQKDFHAKKSRHRQKIVTPRAPETGMTVTSGVVDDNLPNSVQGEDLVPPDVSRESGVIEEATPPPSPPKSSETTEMTTVTSSTPRTTTTTMPTSTIPPLFCVVQRPQQTLQYIRLGRGKRLYREDTPECSELCQCGEGQVLRCNAICVETSPCKTDFAFYNHAAPAYQAYRGRCLCYSGRFICMRPLPDAYSIPHGVFMFLGYSETDENLLKPHSNLTVLDAVSSLDTFMRQEVDNQTTCTLLLYNLTRENVIAVARLRPENGIAAGSNSTGRPPVHANTQSLQHLTRVKDECGQMLRDLSDKINNRHHEVYTHPLLSIFKMAEIEVKLPRASGGATSVAYGSTMALCFALVGLAVSRRLTATGPALFGLGGFGTTERTSTKIAQKHGVS